jgi:hypothetical protein
MAAQQQTSHVRQQGNSIAGPSVCVATARYSSGPGEGGERVKERSVTRGGGGYEGQRSPHQLLAHRHRVVLGCACGQQHNILTCTSGAKRTGHATIAQDPPVPAPSRAVAWRKGHPPPPPLVMLAVCRAHSGSMHALYKATANGADGSPSDRLAGIPTGRGLGVREESRARRQQRTPPAFKNMVARSKRTKLPDAPSVSVTATAQPRGRLLTDQLVAGQKDSAPAIAPRVWCAVARQEGGCARGRSLPVSCRWKRGPCGPPVHACEAAINPWHSAHTHRNRGEKTM